MTTTTPEWLEQLVDREIGEPIRRDPRTSATHFLGWPRERVFFDVIGGGQADFDEPVGHLSGDERALLYAKYNQPRHLDELGHAFGRLFAERGSCAQPTVIDLGCGPFTAGLSLAAVLGAGEPFRYFGVDRAESMLRLGQRLAIAAKELGGLHPTTHVWFGDELEAADFGAIRGELTVVVASYLLASPTVEPESLAAAIIAAVDRVGPGPAAVFYTNSANTKAGTKFAAFRDRLVHSGFGVVVDEVELFDQTNKSHKDVHYALMFRPAKTAIVMQRREPR